MEEIADEIADSISSLEPITLKSFSLIINASVLLSRWVRPPPTCTAHLSISPHAVFLVHAIETPPDSLTHSEVLVAMPDSLPRMFSTTLSQLKTLSDGPEMDRIWLPTVISPPSSTFQVKSQEGNHSAKSKSTGTLPQNTPALFDITTASTILPVFPSVAESSDK